MLQSPFSSKYQNNSAKGLNKIEHRAQPFIGAFIQLYYFLIGAGAVPVRLLMRKKFGERSLTPMSWAVSILMHIWYIYLYMFMAIGYGIYELLLSKYYASEVSFFEYIILMLIIFMNPILVYFYQVFYKRAKSHFRQVIKKARENDLTIKSSFYRGDAIHYKKYLGSKINTFLGDFVVDEEILRIIVEPKKVFYAGLLITFFSAIVSAPILIYSDVFLLRCLAIYIGSLGFAGLLISLSAACLFLEEFGLSMRVRDAALDIIDGEIDLNLVMQTKQKMITEQSETSNNKPESDSFPLVKIH